LPAVRLNPAADPSAELPMPPVPALAVPEVLAGPRPAGKIQADVPRSSFRGLLRAQSAIDIAQERGGAKVAQALDSLFGIKSSPPSSGVVLSAGDEDSSSVVSPRLLLHGAAAVGAGVPDLLRSAGRDGRQAAALADFLRSSSLSARTAAARS
jgi:hypothetical protein